MATRNVTAQPPADTDGDEAAIRASADAFVEAFNRHDAAAVAQLWTENGEYVDEAGQRYEGRAAIQHEYEQFFAEHKDVSISIAIAAIRLVSPETAIEDGSAVVDPVPPGPPSRSKYVAVHSKGPDGNWRLASVRDYHVGVPTTYDHLSRLEPFVGSFSAEHGGMRVEVNGHWNHNKSFLRRDFEVFRDGQAIESATEVIGWDPTSRQVASWSFAADGGHAKSVWTPLDNGWIVASDGMTADGTPTTAVDMWVPLL
ncbi:MAG: SgcJ/EcaC family oxidoreductase, partial [Planctomycetales bacterium]|nr:SgcJ/EcaC family oxidoreductase [Planctomycetales bacterium]